MSGNQHTFLFSLFINDLAIQINDLQAEIPLWDDKVLSVLMYADDLVVIAPTCRKCQDMLDIVTKWCHRWGMAVNIRKTQVVHVRNHQRPRCSDPIFLDFRELGYVKEYKYLGCWVDKILNNEKTVEALTAAAGRSYGRIVNILKHMGDMGYETYGTLYHSYVLLWQIMPRWSGASRTTQHLRYYKRECNGSF